jgi:hypothetical protein
MTTATHFRLGVLKVKSFNDKTITVVVDGIEKVFLNDPTKIYINGTGVSSFSEYESAEKIVLDTLKSLGIENARVEKSNKSESVYITVGSKKIRISGHKDYQLTSLVDVRIDTTMAKNDIGNLIKKTFKNDN